MGMVATTVAIRPEPMPSFWAKPTRFMASNTISPPTSAELRHCRAVGRAAPCHRASASINSPAARKRLVFMNNGGMLFRATDNPKYVVPHTTYTSSRASHSRALNAAGVSSLKNVGMSTAFVENIRL